MTAFEVVEYLANGMVWFLAGMSAHMIRKENDGFDPARLSQ